MSQIHKQFTDDQIKVLLKGYCQGQLSRVEVQDVLKIGKSQFFKLIKAYRQDPDGFTVTYQRTSPGRLSAEVEAEIEHALLREKHLVEDPDLPISGYNYTAMGDRLREKGIQVSVPTIISRAKQLDCHQPRRKRKTHSHEVLPATIGAWIQHDASTHLWSHHAQEKWVLITSIDD